MILEKQTTKSCDHYTDWSVSKLEAFQAISLNSCRLIFGYLGSCDLQSDIEVISHILEWNHPLHIVSFLYWRKALVAIYLVVTIDKNIAAAVPSETSDKSTDGCRHMQKIPIWIVFDPSSGADVPDTRSSSTVCVLLITPFVKKLNHSWFLMQVGRAVVVNSCFLSAIRKTDFRSSMNYGIWDSASLNCI